MTARHRARGSERWNLRILILGGYGFIGAEIARALAKAGHDIVGLGRNAEIGRRLIPEAAWIAADIAKLDTPEKWAPRLKGFDVIVNAAGALQDGPRDRLSAVHHRSIAACVAAAEASGVQRFVQISAVGADLSASTDFMSTKALGDVAVKMSALDWTILRPGLVLGRNAFGGTALLRMLAAAPLIETLAYPAAKVQTVAIDDVTMAVRRAVEGDIPTRAAYDLVEVSPHTLRDIVRALRRWLGFGEARLSLTAPPLLTRLVSSFADAAGVLGWRSPLRSTAMRVMSEGVLGDPEPLRRVSGRALKSLGETLAAMPSTAQERVYARAQLALPLMIVALAVFWIASGAVGLMATEAAATHLYSAVGVAAAKAVVAAGSVVDMAIGALLLLRRTARQAAVASVAVAGFYLVAGTLTEPTLWLDPFGALAKIIPLMAMGIAVALLLEER